MGVSAPSEMIDSLFDTLDVDRGGSLDMSEVRKALKRFTEEAETRRNHIRTLGLEVIAKFKAARRGQAEYQVDQQES